MKQAIIKRDGKVVATIPNEGPCDILAWFMHNTSQSMDWAVRYEGYSVEETQTDLAS